MGVINHLLTGMIFQVWATRSDDTTTGEPMELDTTEMPTDSFEPVGTTQEMRLRTASLAGETTSHT